MDDPQAMSSLGFCQSYCPATLIELLTFKIPFSEWNLHLETYCIRNKHEDYFDAEQCLLNQHRDLIHKQRYSDLMMKWLRRVIADNLRLYKADNAEDDSMVRTFKKQNNRKFSIEKKSTYREANFCQKNPRSLLI